MVCVLDNIGAFFISMEKIMTNLYENKKWLEQKYTTEILSMAQIAKICNCHTTTICNWLKKHNIKSRKSGGVKQSIDKRFGRYVNKDNQNGCWIWTGAKFNNGYGAIDGNGSHRLSWELHNGPIPKDLCVCHKCDNPSCVNPEHLFLGTQKDNIQDMIKKGRRGDIKGEKHPHSKLTEEKVRKIRDLYEIKDYTMNELADMYAVNQKTIWELLHKITWKHV